MGSGVIYLEVNIERSRPLFDEASETVNSERPYSQSNDGA